MKLVRASKHLFQIGEKMVLKIPDVKTFTYFLMSGSKLFICIFIATTRKRSRNRQFCYKKIRLWVKIIYFFIAYFCMQRVKLFVLATPTWVLEARFQLTNLLWLSSSFTEAFSKENSQRKFPSHSTGKRTFFCRLPYMDSPFDYQSHHDLEYFLPLSVLSQTLIKHLKCLAFSAFSIIEHPLRRFGSLEFCCEFYQNGFEMAKNGSDVTTLSRKF